MEHASRSQGGRFRLFFRRRQKSGDMARHSDIGSGQEPAHYVQIEFDMMLKGSVYPRRKDSSASLA